MGLLCINPPLLDPVTLPELKQFCRLDPGDSSQDNTINMLALDALSFCENFTARRFVRQDWRLLMDFFPGYIDLKLAGTKVSSPFVSGSNAVLVGIRYAIVLPYPPVQELLAFNYQNANGQTTSMITGPFDIASVSNIISQPIQVVTVQPHGLQTGASITIAGNDALLAVLGGQSTEVVTVFDPNTLVLNGTIGTGSAIPGGGEVNGFNFNQDLSSNPARLSPVFGQMWPVARVVLNAVSLDYRIGYANPITVTIDAASKTVTSSDYSFQLTDVAREISIPGAGPNGLPLNTIVTGLAGSPPAGATLRDVATTTVAGELSLIVNTPSAKPGHWSKIRRAICVHTLESYLKRLPTVQIEDTVQKILYPVRDLRQ